MKVTMHGGVPIWRLFVVGILILFPIVIQAQSSRSWYKNAQERIDPFRKGSFGIGKSTLANSIPMKLFPNPASDNINIVFKSAPYLISIMNTIEVLAFSENADANSFQVNVGRFKRGIYLIRLSNACNDAVNVQKI